MTDNDRGPQGLDVVIPGVPHNQPPFWEDTGDSDQRTASTFRSDQTMYPPRTDEPEYDYLIDEANSDPGVTDPADADGVNVRTGASPETVQAQQEQGQDRTPNAKPLHSDQGNEGAPS